MREWSVQPAEHFCWDAPHQLCHDGLGLPPGLLDAAIRYETRSVWIAMRHGFECDGFLAEIDAKRGHAHMATAFATMLNAAANIDQPVLQHSVWRVHDIDDKLCGHHIEAWLEHGGGNLTRHSALALTSLSLEIHLERLNSTTWRWTHRAASDDALQHSRRLLRQHIARGPHRGRRFALVVYAEPTHGRGIISVALPWFLKFVPSHSTFNGSPLLDTANVTPPHGRSSGSIEVYASSRYDHIEVAFDPLYLPASHWPFDQFRGFVVPPARLVLPDQTTVAYSAACLVSLPEADLSMPFNAIAIQSTILAFFIGHALAMLVRKSHPDPSYRPWREDVTKGART